MPNLHRLTEFSTVMELASDLFTNKPRDTPTTVKLGYESESRYGLRSV